MGIPGKSFSRPRSSYASLPDATFKSLPLGGAINVANEDELLELLASGDINEVDCCFADPLGQWHHCSFHPSMVTRETLQNGFPFDGSSIRLLAKVEKSDMFMKPDPTSCFIDPFLGDGVLHMNCWLLTAEGEPCSRCPRTLADRCEAWVASQGLADKVYIGFEAEFFIFDNVQYSIQNNRVAFSVDCKEEAYWNSDAYFEGRGNLGHRSLVGRGYCPVPPEDRRHNLRASMLRHMEALGLPVEKHHHEVGACQHELGLRYGTLRQAADWCLTYKYVVKNLAHAHGVTATFLPKPMPMTSGSGMHVHMSFWKNGKNCFFDEQGQYSQLSKQALFAIGGILSHAQALLAITSPTTNSYKRLVPGFEAPCCVAFSQGNRSAAIRIPVSARNANRSKRLEFRCPDPSCCSYLAFAAITMAAVDGIKRQIAPPEPLECDLYSLSEAARAKLQVTPASLSAALDALEKDHQFLLQGDVFSEDFLRAYIEFKRKECLLVDFVPHPKEYELYYHC
ncbi:hypothetical protein Efla_000127 [Eimeria flavescens]